MAAYDYRCRDCGSQFEVRRAITADAPSVMCPSGHSDVSRVWSAVSVAGLGATPAPASASAPSGGSCCGGGCCS